MTLIDTNILIDLVIPDPVWFERSRAALTLCATRGAILIVDAVFAELSAGFKTAEDCAAFTSSLGLEHSAMQQQALWRAGQAFRDYRKRGGAKTGVLPDFFIGAQASVLGITLLTRDEGRYRAYFPEVAIVGVE